MGAERQAGRLPLGMGISDKPGEGPVPGPLAFRGGPAFRLNRRRGAARQGGRRDCGAGPLPEGKRRRMGGLHPRKISCLGAGGKNRRPGARRAALCGAQNHDGAVGYVRVRRQALEILLRFADWFSRWTEKLSREEMDRLLDYETGGMLEVWANLYGETGKPEHLALMRRYARNALFDRLLAGEDALTNMHANTTVPEALGAARAYEVTGDSRWRKIVEAYWRCAVKDRPHFCTGGADSGEIWCPPGRLAERLGTRTHEHCVAYNMVRLAEFLFRWTGKAEYADYMERSILNGILAQQNPVTGMPAYYLPLEPGARKIWGTPTETFWCCHGSVVQAQTLYESLVFYPYDEGLALGQYIPSAFRWQRGANHIDLCLRSDSQAGNTQAAVRLDAGARGLPETERFLLTVKCETPEEFTLRIRIPWWAGARPSVAVNGEPQPCACKPSEYLELKRLWKDDTITIEFPKALALCPLSGRPEMAAFLYGPTVLAGLCGTERALYGDPEKPESFLRPIDERNWTFWRPLFITHDQPESIRFMPLNLITDETYTVYFPLCKK